MKIPTADNLGNASGKIQSHKIDNLKVDEGRNFIILKGKEATHKFKDSDDRMTLDEVKDFNDVAFFIPSGYSVLDFDTKDEANIAFNICKQLEIKTSIMQTTRGYHFWFKTPSGEHKCYTAQRLAIGISADCKVGGHNAYDKIKQDGQWRKWIRKEDDMEEMPAFFRPVRAPKDQFQFKGMVEGDGRNQELFNYIPYLQTRGFTKEEIQETIMIINMFIFDEPLPDEEIATICRDESFLSDEEVEKQKKKYGLDKHADESDDEDDPDEWWDEDEDGNKVFRHNKFGDKLIEKFHVIEYHGLLYTYDDGYYKQDDKVIEKQMLKIWPGIKRAQRTEVLEYLKIRAHISDNEVKTDPYMVNLNNGRFDLRTGELLDFTPDVIEFTRIPVTYDPEAYCADLDRLLDNVFLGKQDLIDMFDEITGSMLIKNAKMQKAFMCKGRGSNGKSTILELWQAFLGHGNYSTIDLKDLGRRFITAELENKMANIGDDIDVDTPITETGIMKKIIAGNEIQTERKGQDPFNFKPYATLIFSTNDIPKSFDKTEGFYRRWAIIPFDAKFKDTDPDFDPMIEDKVMTDESLSYLLNRAIKGAQRLMKRGRFNEPESVKEMMAEYKTVNSNVLSWIEDQELKMEHFLDTPMESLYEEFSDWCKQSGVTRVTGKKNFYNEIRDQFDFDKAPRQKSDQKRYFVVRI